MKETFQRLRDSWPSFPGIKGLQSRWLKNMVATILVLVLLCVTVLSLVVSGYYYSALEEDMEARADSAIGFLKEYQNESSESYRELCKKYVRSFRSKEDMYLDFISTDHKLLASSDTETVGWTVAGEDIDRAIEELEPVIVTGSYVTGDRYMILSVPLLRDGSRVVGVLRYVNSLERVDRQISRFALTAAFVGCLLLAVVYAGGRYYVKSILEPVSEITATAKRIAAGGYGVQIKGKFQDEIGELSDTINDMSNNLAQSEKTQSEFMSSVSHELRTPLTAISGWSETLLDTGVSVDTAEARRGLSIILRETRRLTSMVEELLEFSRMQDGRFKLNVSMSDIRSEFEDTVFMYGSRLQQEEINLEYLDNDDEIPEIPCDTSRMRQVFLNILDNGAKHGGEGGRITAEIRLEGREVVIRIRDFGPGVPEEELPLIKKKFYKGSSKARGSGIGLAVCEEIVTMHGGSLEITNAEGGGTLVTIRLPVGEK